MYPVIFVMIITVIIIALFLRSDIRFIVENTWSQNCLSAELEKVNFSINVLKLVPVLDIKMIRIWIRNIVGNAILLLPMGILLPLLWTKFRKVGRVTLFAFLFSLGIETLQLLLTLMGNIGRAFDVDDILLNTLGAFIGVSLYSICNRIAGSEPEPGEKYSCHGDRPRGR